MFQDIQSQILQTNTFPNQNQRTINLKVSNLTNQKQIGESIFRKPKKIIKTLKIKAQAKLEDKILIHEQIQNWLNKLHTKKEAKNSNQKNLSIQKLSNQNKQAITTVYDLIRKDQKLAQCLPITIKHKISLKRDTLKLDLQEVLNMRSKSQKRKVAIQQILFQSQIESKANRLMGFRPIASKCTQRLVCNKKETISNTSKVKSISFFQKTKRRTYTLQNNIQRNQTIQRLNAEKSYISIFQSSSRIGNYSSRSRQRKCWQTIGLKEWINKPTKRNLSGSRF